MAKKTSRERQPKHFVPIVALVQAAHHGDLRTVDMASRMLLRAVRDFDEKLAAQLEEIVESGASPLRGISPSPIPTDTDSLLELLKMETWTTEPPRPELNTAEREHLEEFIRERTHADRLAAVEEAPPSSLLFIGPPGVGKTMTARWLAYRLKLPLARLDLATVVSSFLGKTGQNLRAILDYCKVRPCVLFLDEFDALAKRRDDRSDIGELKRIVNVLLVEIESWPSRGVLLAATNHPDLLDPAIWRRFDGQINFVLPGRAERKRILQRTLEPLAVAPAVLELAVDLSEQLSGSDVVRTARTAKRKASALMLDTEVLLLEALTEHLRSNWDRRRAERLVLVAKKIDRRRFTNVFLGRLLGKSESTVRSIMKEAGHAR